MSNSERIINFVEEHSLLFDYTHPCYKDSRVKDKMWKELGEILDKDSKYKFMGYLFGTTVEYKKNIKVIVLLKTNLLLPTNVTGDTMYCHSI